MTRSSSRWSVDLVGALLCVLSIVPVPAAADEQAQGRPKIGLALGGGGAKGGAHVGVLKVFEELNIPIDMIAGVSMGSLVSAAYAYDAGNFEESIKKIKSQLKGALFDYTFPAVSIARGRRFDKRLQNWFQHVCIEDLWLPYFCVSSNLSDVGLVVFERDQLWEEAQTFFCIHV